MKHNTTYIKMKDKKYYYQLAAAALLTLTACSKEAPDGMTDNNIISLSASVSSQNVTRASSDDALQLIQFVSGKDIHVEAYETGESTAYTNGNYTTGNGGAMTGTLYYPASRNAIDICAYYPSTVSSASTEFSVSATQTTAGSGIANYQSSDLMYATKLTECAKGSTHALTFHHALSQIIVNITNGDGVTADDITNRMTAVTINNTVTAASLSITDGVITASKSGTTTADISILGTGASNIGLIVPQQVAAGTFITVTYAGNDYAVALSDAFTFAAGNSYTFTLTLGAAGLSLSSATISAWTNPYASTTPPADFTQGITL